ncbi:hypothetical protein DFP74_2675 [Nocardiopsis sp. Huas11]|nr:hypothetical protein DFP74_2675 [Nocardiopsis sp. Huas11]
MWELKRWRAAEIAERSGLAGVLEGQTEEVAQEFFGPPTHCGRLR